MCSIFSRKLFNTSRLLYKTSYTKSCEIVKLSRNLSKRLYSTSDDHSNDKFPKQLSNSDKNEDETDRKDRLQESETVENKKLAPDIQLGYKEFRDEDSETIFDVDEIRQLNLEQIRALDAAADPYEHIDRTRGVTGVFDIEDLVETLRNEKAQDLFVATVPHELGYVDYMVIITGKSQRHMNALATFVRKAFKLKRNSTDIIPKIEGADCKNWIALDLGNIALHIFNKKSRGKYDLETLWAVGSAYDRAGQVDSEEDVQSKYKEFLAHLQPADAVDEETLNESSSEQVKQ